MVGHEAVREDDEPFESRGSPKLREHIAHDIGIETEICVRLMVHRVRKYCAGPTYECPGSRFGRDISFEGSNQSARGDAGSIGPGLQPQDPAHTTWPAVV